MPYHQSITLSEETQQLLQELAIQKGKTTQTLIEEAIHLYLSTHHKRQPRSIGMGQSSIPDLSERVDELLWQEP